MLLHNGILSVSTTFWDICLSKSVASVVKGLLMYIDI